MQLQSQNEYWNSLLQAYFDTDPMTVRLLAEKLIPIKAREIINLLIEQTGDKNTRPCLSRCISVEQGKSCSLWEKHLTRLLESVPTEPETAKQFVVTVYFMIHSSAYERWEDSFDYATIGCRLHLASQFLNISDHIFAEDEKPLVQILHYLTYSVQHMSLRENSLMSNNSELMAAHALKSAKNQENIVLNCQKLIHLQNWIGLVANQMSEFFTDQKELTNITAEVAELIDLSSKNHSEFLERFAANKQRLFDYLLEVEESGDIEGATELRGYLKFLEYFAKIEDFNTLKMQQIEGTLSFGFFKEIHDIDVGHGSKKSIKIRSKGELIEFLIKSIQQGKFGNFPVPVGVISKDPPPDILESSIGKSHFDNILLLFDDIEVYNLEENPAEPLFTFTPRLLHYALGVGCVELEFECESLGVTAFQTLKNIGTPHSPEFFIKYIDKDGTEHIWSRLNEFAEDLIGEYCKKFDRLMNEIFDEDDTDSSVNETSPEWIDTTQSWFTNFWIYNILNDKGTTLNYGDLKTHWQYPGIVTYQRADRASIDDWITVDVDGLDIENLAKIRGHRDDLFIISENHAITYLPDDPKFISNQYLITAKWMFLIRTLVMYCLIASDHVVDDLRDTIQMATRTLKGKLSEQQMKDIENMIQDRKIEMQNYNILSINAIDHVASAGVSQYADHSLLLRRVFEKIHLLEIIDFLMSKLDTLKTLGEDLNGVITQFVALKEEESSKRLETLLAILGLLQIIPTVDAIYNAFFSENEPSFQYWIVLASSLGILGLTWFLFLLFRRLRKRKQSGK